MQSFLPPCPPPKAFLKHLKLKNPEKVSRINPRQAGKWEPSLGGAVALTSFFLARFSSSCSTSFPS